MAGLDTLIPRPLSALPCHSQTFPSGAAGSALGKGQALGQHQGQGPWGALRRTQGHSLPSRPHRSAVVGAPGLGGGAGGAVCVGRSVVAGGGVGKEPRERDKAGLRYGLADSAPRGRGRLRPVGQLLVPRRARAARHLEARKVLPALALTPSTPLFFPSPSELPASPASPPLSPKAAFGHTSDSDRTPRGWGPPVGLSAPPAPTPGLGGRVPTSLPPLPARSPAPAGPAHKPRPPLPREPLIPHLQEAPGPTELCSRRQHHHSRRQRRRRAPAPAPAPAPSPSAMQPRRAPAPALLLLLLLGAGPRSGCLASPVPAAPLPVPGPCSAQPCQNGGVCSQLPAPDPQSPAAAGEPGYSCTCPAGVSGTNCQVSGRGGRGAGHCALSSAGLQEPDPSFSLFGVGDGSGLLARVNADPWPTLQASLLCLPWFSGRASSGLSGRAVPGPGGYLGSHTSGTTVSRQLVRPSRPGPSHRPLEPGLGARPSCKEGPACERPWRDVRVQVTPALCPAGPEGEL